LLKISEKVIEHSNLILSEIKDVEASARGYVISQDSFFLKPYKHASNKMMVSLNQLKSLTVNNPSQRRRVDSLDSYVNKKLDVSSKMIDLRNEDGLISAIDYVSSRVGKNYTDSIRKITNSINEEEGFILLQQKTDLENNKTVNERFAATLFLLMSFFTIVLLIAMVNYLNQNKKKTLQASELIIANRELVFQNEEKEKRADELLIANEELAYQNEEKEKRADELLIANEELAYQNKEKEKRAAELVITNQELTTTKVYLKEYIIGLEEMIAMTSHRVRQPIANILGLSDLLEQSLNSPLELKQIIIYIKESILKLDVFTKEISGYMIDLNRKKK
jgi:CHASE3 domain sensor protein